MALAVSVIFTVVDNANKESTTTIHVPTGFSVVQYGEFAAAMAQLIADLSDGQITSVSISIPLSLAGATIRAVASAAADVAEKAKFAAMSVVNGLRAFFNIPTYDESKNLPSSDSVDLADPDVAAFVALIETGAGAFPCDLRGNSLSEVLWGDEKFVSFG